MSKLAVGVVALVVGLASAFVFMQRTSRPRFERQVPWAGSGVWLRAETHVHTKFSDGGHTVDEVADRAVANGCDVLAITDHLDSGLTAATPEYHAAIAAARKRHTDLVLITGFEWNIPPGKGQDHAVILVPPALDLPEVWADFKRRFDDLDKEGENPELAVDAFEWLRAVDAEEKAGAPVVFLDHPARRASSVDAVRQQLETLTRIGNGPFAGVEGAPGHQKATPLGAYGGKLVPVDRWDPAIAPQGAAWDSILASGAVMSGALATSDFHGESNGDYWPCQFSSTLIRARERSAAGVLDALRAGTFVGVHGGIARDVEISLTANGLPRPAFAGEVVRLRTATPVTVDVTATASEMDWEGKPNRIDAVDVIGVTETGATVLHSGPLVDGKLRHQFDVPSGGIVLRARGRRVVDDGPDLLFYTNAVTVR